MAYYFALVVTTTLLLLAPLAAEEKKHPQQLSSHHDRNKLKELNQQGKIPAWIDPDGRMRVASGNNRWETFLKNDEEAFASRFIPSWKKMEPTSGQSAQTCSDCHTGVMSPTLTNPDKSDIFKYDYWAPEANETNVPDLDSCGKPSDGCVYEIIDEGDPSSCNLKCENMNMDGLPELPPKLAVFTMRKNNLDRLQKNAFRNKSVLEMKLEDNAIKEIEEDAFYGIQNLQSLSLEFNFIEKIHWKEMFNGLDSLLILSLRGNNFTLRDRPNRPSNDCNNNNTNKNETNILTKLVYLNLAENPIQILFPDSFRSLENSPVKELNLQSCSLVSIDKNAFKPLKFLEHVDLFNNSGLLQLHSSIFLPSTIRQIGLGLQTFIGIPNIFDSTVSKTLKIINLSRNNREILSSPLPEWMNGVESLILESCGLSNLQPGIFKNLAHLTQLYLGDNDFTVILPDVLPKTLSVLSLRMSSPSFSSLFKLADGMFRDMNQLIWLDMTNLKMEPFLSPTSFAGLEKLFALQLRGSGIKEIAGGTFAPLRGSLWWLDLGQNKELSSLSDEFSDGLDKVYALFLDHCSLDFPDAKSSSSTSAAAADEAVVVGQPFKEMRNLHLLYMNHNEIRTFHPRVLANLDQLDLVYMDSNLLSKWEKGTTKDFPPNNTVLVLSNNRIALLPNQTFEEFKNLYYIDLSDNAFSCNCPIKDLKRLMAGNETSVIVNNNETYWCADGLSGTIKIIQDMTDEEFHCARVELTTTVSSIPTSTESTELPITTTESSETTSTETESEFSTTMTTSTPERTTKTSSADTSKPTTSTEQTTTNYPDENSSTMPSILGGASAAFFLLLVAGTCYYKRTTVQRQWFLFKHRHDGRSFLSERKDSEVEFEYDAFVSFSEHDRPWVYSHLVPNLEFSKSSNISSEASDQPWFQLCLHDRDFTVGQRITENIIENIAKSRKVIIVLSKNYVESKWCQFELHLSQHRLLEVGRKDNLVLILLEDVPKKQQEGWLRYLIRTRTYLAWRVDLEGQRLFWQRLRHVLVSYDQEHSPILKAKH